MMRSPAAVGAAVVSAAEAGSMAEALAPPASGAEPFTRAAMAVPGATPLPAAMALLGATPLPGVVTGIGERRTVGLIGDTAPQRSERRPSARRRPVPTVITAVTMATTTVVIATPTASGSARTSIDPRRAAAVRGPSFSVGWTQRV